MQKLIAILCLPVLLCSCVAGAVISAAGNVVEAGVNTTGAVVGAAIPDGDEDEDD